MREKPAIPALVHREGYVRGWRVYYRDRGWLRSWTLPEHVWDGPVMTARCYESRMQGYLVATGDLSRAPRYHRSPDEDCTCGIYAVADRRGLIESGMLVPRSRVALAQVRGWGKTIVGNSGYRFEHAQIERLWLLDVEPGEHTGAEREYALRYHCPVEAVPAGAPIAE